MPEDAATSSPGPSLRDKLVAHGAKPHRRMSDLSRYMLDHYDELHALVVVDRYGWADLAILLTQVEGLVDARAQPLTANVAKLAWSRINKHRRQRAVPPVLAPILPPGLPAAIVTPNPLAVMPMSPVAAPFSLASPTPMAPMAAPLAAAPSRERDLPFANPVLPPIDIRPARPRGSGVPPAADTPSVATRSLLTDAEVQSQVDALERLQGGPKLPPTEVL